MRRSRDRLGGACNAKRKKKKRNQSQSERQNTQVSKTKQHHTSLQWEMESKKEKKQGMQRAKEQHETMAPHIPDHNHTQACHPIHLLAPLPHTNTHTLSCQHINTFILAHKTVSNTFITSFTQAFCQSTTHSITARSKSVLSLNNNNNNNNNNIRNKKQQGQTRVTFNMGCAWCV